jgi:hypothetical protein
MVERPKLSALVHPAIGDHELYGADVVDTIEWIAIQDDQIGATAYWIFS